MIGVKITLLIIVITLIYTFLVKSMYKNESIETKIKTLEGIYPKYIIVWVILVFICFIGIIYSTIYLLFF